MNRTILAATLALAMAAGALPSVARAENQMGYRLLSAADAAGLQNQHGALGLDVGQGQQISDSGLTFQIIRIKSVRRGSSGDKAGLRAGDQIIAVDGQVFASLKAFAAYVGSRAPGQQVSVDYIPRGGGPAQAERIGVTVGSGAKGSGSQTAQDQAPASGMSTRMKIGIGAAALFGCYELGCFSHRPATPPPQ